MATYWFMTAGGGALSALLYLSVVLGSPGALLLAYLAPLPLFTVSLGLGTVAGVTAGGTAALIIGVAGGLIAALLFLAVNLPPVAILTRQALLSRTAADGSTEWYPVGHLVMWLTGLGILGLAIFALAAASGEAGVEGSTRAFLSTGVERMFSSISEADRDKLLDAVVPYFPAAVIASWMGMIAINACLAQGLLGRFARNLRPSPDLATIDLPRELSLGLLVCVGIALFASGALAYLGRNAALVLVGPFFILGLGVMHALARRFAQRNWILIGSYAAMLMFGWPIAIVAGMGLLEQWVGLRRRFAAPPPTT
jgi:hypothetical protein